MKSTESNPIIVALDVPSASAASELVHQVAGSVGAFKVGLELFNAEGPSIFKTVRQAGGEDIKIFYDAKFHDISNTVAGAIRSACKYSPWMITYTHLAE
jgi:orotidine-5'-phosphate decarboxylase